MHGVTAIFQVGGLVLAIAMFLVLRKRFARESAEAMVDKQKKLNGTGENEGGVMLKSLMKKDEDNNDTTTWVWRDSQRDPWQLGICVPEALGQW